MPYFSTKAKEKFIKKYMKQANESYHHSSMANERTLIRLARAELKYSENTNDCDISSSLRNVWKRLTGRVMGWK